VGLFYAVVEVVFFFVALFVVLRREVAVFFRGAFAVFALIGVGGVIVVAAGVFAVKGTSGVGSGMTSGVLSTTMGGSSVVSLCVAKSRALGWRACLALNFALAEFSLLFLPIKNSCFV
jgi:hypothetical protein